MQFGDIYKDKEGASYMWDGRSMVIRTSEATFAPRISPSDPEFAELVPAFEWYKQFLTE